MLAVAGYESPRYSTVRVGFATRFRYHSGCFAWPPAEAATDEIDAVRPHADRLLELVAGFRARDDQDYQRLASGGLAAVGA